ncbi:hypothetical protein ACH5RR_015498 [Cinchona calisaya]|uniref:Zinc finger A20 and AN1 domain-containing stress-associated protein 8 n=1 Tax=Cinchona calisaya TaxID=153742 RepID=A0ABD2ZU61_9GENT
MESSKETGCQPPEVPILCINNCGFFGNEATMNMCSKCHKEMILKQEQAKLAAASIENIVNGSSSSKGKEHDVTCALAAQAVLVDLEEVSTSVTPNILSGQSSEVKVNEGPNRCTTCHKRVGLTGFNCRCGNMFCAVHRYSDKHECSFNYRTAAQHAIARANPDLKAEKLDKI